MSRPSANTFWQVMLICRLAPMVPGIFQCPLDFRRSLRFARCVAQVGVPDGRVTLCASSSAGFWITLGRLPFTLVIVTQIIVISHIFQVFFYQGGHLPEQHLRPSLTPQSWAVIPANPLEFWVRDWVIPTSACLHQRRIRGCMLFVYVCASTNWN